MVANGKVVMRSLRAIISVLARFAKFCLAWEDLVESSERSTLPQHHPFAFRHYYLLTYGVVLSSLLLSLSEHLMLIS